MRAAVFVWVLCAAVFGSSPAAAAEASEGAAATWLGLPVWVWLLLNLVIFVGALVYFLGPPIVRFLEARQLEIRRSLEEAARQRAAAERTGPDLEQRIQELEQEIRELAERSETEGNRDQREILEEAERERERILTQAREQIDYRLAQARQELKEYTATLAADLAAERLESGLTPDDRRRLLEDNLAKLEREVR